MPSIFSRYAPFVQDFIYRNGWERLRGIQVAAGDAVFNTDAHVLLTASTASGKTEAAFFPILTLLSENPSASVGALYIAPLKALINDQFERLTDLCAEGGIPVWSWHGDVAQSRKKKLLEHPSGVLQITPESLEAMLLRKHAMIPTLFGDLRFIVIDEIHSLMRSDRGLQTMCLIERLARLAGTEPRRIGLSATIGNTALAAEFLRSGSKRPSIVPKVDSPPVRWRLSMEHFWVSGEGKRAPDAQVTEVSSDARAVAHPGAAEKEELSRASDLAPRGADPGIGYIFEHTRGRKCLVFSNSREECELVTSTLHKYCELRHEPDRFAIHHGNLSTAIRSDAEALMKDAEKRVTTCTTATLELGIDVGRLERAFQIDAPFTVSGFLQRLGRTGRRGEPPEMWFVIREDEPEPRAMLPETIPWKLLQAIAVVECYREDRWVEPPKLDRLPYSLLYHQTMMTLASEGEMKPAELAGRVLTLSAFRRISPDDYKVLLRGLLASDQIERTESGGLIVGLQGERQLSSFRFYAVFQENEEFSVRCESEELGTIVRPPPAGEKIAIAGHVWRVEDVDLKRHVVWCSRVEGTVPAFFGLCPGDINTYILEKMCAVLRSDAEYPYLMQGARERLHEGRLAAFRARATDTPLIPLGEGLWCLMPWLGTYPFLALERLIRLHAARRIGLKSFDVSRPYFMLLRMKAGAAEFFRAIYEAAENLHDPLELLYPGEIPVFEKYDEFVPAELVRKGFAMGVLGVSEMKARVRGWAGIYAGNTQAIANPAASIAEDLPEDGILGASLKDAAGISP
ncbi:DEAD/DEAH box helicase [uncultured Sutterella sp.]|uniref:DEAD/DEAH box helicase n=1 Tax=uncultured Sutterella sp. TaxID=286133 RepID=UPI00259B6421|nr:DEAD/DEAH box helicase [uncultured Sutterella sp.]